MINTFQTTSILCHAVNDVKCLQFATYLDFNATHPIVPDNLVYTHILQIDKVATLDLRNYTSINNEKVKTKVANSLISKSQPKKVST